MANLSHDELLALRAALIELPALRATLAAQSAELQSLRASLASLLPLQDLVEERAVRSG